MNIASTQAQEAPAEVAAPDLAVVLALDRAGTLSEAGLRLGVDASTVFRAVQRLEKRLGQRLFERSRAGYRTTELGALLARHGERIEAELEAVREALQQAPGEVSGLVRISTTDSVLQGLLLPALRGLSPVHPLLQLELSASNELASLTRRDADIALRVTKRPPQHLVARPLGPVRVALYVPRRANKAKTLDDVVTQALPWVAVDEALPEHPSVQWRRRHLPRVQPQLRVSSIVSVLDAVAAGLGVGVLPLFLAEARRELRRVSEPLDEAESPLWLLTHPESRHLRRVSLVASHLVEHLRLP
ncbi:LysR family transcriptional regulator [Aquabacterium sp. A7-Y]|uniref:LysR family transcriptional regulator n=1 Tax=Aquabacterium sp. A7-Y TaxID=1349605 RepID=UPI00223E8C55|nr:LysR family transcriptional regulator [Aquabacterium sp. A7-Y]MCW7538811.1 LysR family transcriptional regulator [Aquabacterium sp. A7-Y]